MHVPVVPCCTGALFPGIKWLVVASRTPRPARSFSRTGSRVLLCRVPGQDILHGQGGRRLRGRESCAGRPASVSPSPLFRGLPRRSQSPSIPIRKFPLGSYVISSGIFFAVVMVVIFQRWFAPSPFLLEHEQIDAEILWDRAGPRRAPSSQSPGASPGPIPASCPNVRS